MAGWGKKNSSKAKPVVEKIIVTNQLELTESKKQVDEIEEDNGSLNILQIKPKK